MRKYYMLKNKNGNKKEKFPFPNEIIKYGKELFYIEKIGNLCNRIYRLGI